MPLCPLGNLLTVHEVSRQEKNEGNNFVSQTTWQTFHVFTRLLFDVFFEKEL